MQSTIIASTVEALSLAANALRDGTNGDLFILGFMLLGPIGGLVVFKVQRTLKPRPISERVKKAGASWFLGTTIKEYGYWWLQPTCRILLWLKVHPTTITLVGLGVVGTGCTLVSAGFFGLGGLFILLGSLSDMLDGMVARERNLISEAGEFVDSVADRYADFMLYFGLLLFYRATYLAAVIITTAAMGSMLVSYARAKAESLGINDVPNGPMQRAERAVYLGFTIYLAPCFSRWAPGLNSLVPNILPVAMCAIIAVLANISAFEMGLYTTRALRRRARENQVNPAEHAHSYSNGSAKQAPSARAAAIVNVRATGDVQPLPHV